MYAQIDYAWRHVYSHYDFIHLSDSAITQFLLCNFRHNIILHTKINVQILVKSYKHPSLLVNHNSYLLLTD